MTKKKARGKTGQHEAKEHEELATKELTEEEKARIDSYRERSQREPAKFKKAKGTSNNPAIALRDPDDPLTPVKMSEALGTTDIDLQQHLLNEVVQTFKGTVSTDGADYDKVVEACNNAMVLLNGIQPRDEIEGMLAIQMVGAHNLAMDAMNRAILGGQTFEGKKANVNQATKMLRTFIMQMEGLRKYRTTSQLKMVVGRVNVSEGGQAIVGTVNQRVDKKNVQK